MITEQALMKFGFTKDKDNFELKKVFKNKIKLKEIHIDVYPENPLITSAEPFMLLSRTTEKNVAVLNNDDRLILSKNDKYQDYIINILFSKITNCYYKDNNIYSEFILNIQNIWYKINVFN